MSNNGDRFRENAFAQVNIRDTFIATAATMDVADVAIRASHLIDRCADLVSFSGQGEDPNAKTSTCRTV